MPSKIRLERRFWSKKRQKGNKAAKHAQFVHGGGNPDGRPELIKKGGCYLETGHRRTPYETNVSGKGKEETSYLF